MIEAVLADTKRGVPISAISARFHNALAESIVAVARRVGQERVALSGGCFQNRYLTERAVWGLRTAGSALTGISECRQRRRDCPGSNHCCRA